MSNLNLDYFHGSEAEQFSFYRLPKILFTDDRFADVSSEAKILYGLLLDRMGLSVKNGWIDEENRVYIYFKLDDVIDMLKIGKDKGIKLFAELDAEKGCGLIKRRRQGLGKPTIIYVMNFVSQSEPEEQPKSETSKTDELCDFQTSEKPRSGCRNSAEVLTSEKPTSGVLKKRSLDFRKSRPLEDGKTEAKDNEFNYNNINNIYANDTYPISSYQRQEAKAEDVIDEIEKYRHIISKNIDYECLKQNYGDDMADGVLELMTEIVCCRKPIVVVACQELPQAMVKERFLKLDYTHIEYVFDSLKKNGSRVRNIKSYMITMLYNSYTTIGHYYTAEVAADSMI